MHTSKTPVLETPRLRLRAPDPVADVDALWSFLKDPEVMRYITGRGAERDDVAAALARSVRYFERFGMGGFVVERKADGRIIGDCLLVPIPHRGVDPADVERRGPETEIGYRFARDVWGQGYATEAARAAMAFAFDERGGNVDTLVGVTDPDNAASGRILVKLGMQDCGLSDAFYDETVHLYSLTRDIYRAQHKPT